MKRFNHFAHRNIVILMLLIFFENLKFFFNKITLIGSGVFGLFDFLMIVYKSFLIVYPIIYIFLYECRPSDTKEVKEQKPREIEQEELDEDEEDLDEEEDDEDEEEDLDTDEEDLEELGTFEDLKISEMTENQPVLQQGKRSNNENLEYIEQLLSRRKLENPNSRRTRRQVKVLIGEEQSILIRGEFRGDVKQNLFKVRNFQNTLRRFSTSVPSKLRILNRKLKKERETKDLVGSEGGLCAETKLEKIEEEEEKDQTEMAKKKLARKNYYDSKRSKLRTIEELDLEKYPYMNRDYSAGLIYVKNLVIYGLIILGNRNSQQNLFIVVQVQLALTIWLGISKPKHLKLKWSWLLQELYFNFYILSIIFYYIDPSENRQNWMVSSYFVGLSVSIFLFMYYVSSEIIYLSFKRLILPKNNRLQKGSQTLTVKDH